jgi:hypothetical protein
MSSNGYGRRAADPIFGPAAHDPLVLRRPFFTIPKIREALRRRQIMAMPGSGISLKEKTTCGASGLIAQTQIAMTISFFIKRLLLSSARGPRAKCRPNPVAFQPTVREWAWRLGQIEGQQLHLGSNLNHRLKFQYHRPRSSREPDYRNLNPYNSIHKHHWQQMLQRLDR